MKEISLEEMRSIQIDMLDKLADFCNTNGIRYYLCGGTLLGAIRHKGFIPWDDDIDINIPRPDLQKLLKISKKTIAHNLVIEAPGDERGNSRSFYRIYNTDTELVAYNKKLGTEYRCNIFIDIFPVDALPKMKTFNYVVYLVSGFLISMGNMSSVGEVVGSTPIKRFLKRMLFPIARMKKPEQWAEITDRYAARRDYKKASYIGVINTEASHRFHERILKTDYEPRIEVEFEGKQYYAPAGFDIYLRNLYGDYMSVPPRNQQVSHHDFKAFRK